MMRHGGAPRERAVQPGLRDVRRLRGPAAGAAFLLCLLLVTWWLAGQEVVGPPPRRQDLTRVDGTVERMRIRDNDRNCLALSVRVQTEYGVIRAVNTTLCRALRGIEPLAEGAPVTLLVEPTGSSNVIWEMTSGDLRLIRYERMRATRQRERRNHHAMWPVVALLCLPFASFIAFWLWEELQELVRRRK
ncbi:hypothetical protein [Longimicrobium sp.]|uniref:hypothetical protein n=1 Tax=Longimicrobium sp. TaxID=2029185 RepID=UPI003B3AEB78